MAYKFTIENNGDKPIKLLSITPRIPEGVTLLQVKDPSLTEIKTKYDDLCIELTQLTRTQINILRDGEKRTKNPDNIDVSKTFANWEISFPMQRRLRLGILPSVLLYLKRIFLYSEEVTEAELKQIFGSPNSNSFIIESRSHAEIALKRFFQESASNLTKELFEAKLEQLGELENAIGDPKTSAIATIEPESFFAMTYILQFPRNLMNSKKFNLTIEGTYSEENIDKRHVGGITAPLMISPNPLILTIIALISSAIGVVLKTAAESSSGDSPIMSKAFEMLIGSAGVSALISSLVFFNVYEFTSLSDRFKMSIGWRSALLIGTLCGLLGERILGAIKSFVGS